MADKNQESASDHTSAAPEREAAKVSGHHDGRLRRVPGRNPHTGQPQGELVRNPPGSNGGTRRGPDKFPRISQSILLRTLAKAKVRRGSDGKKITVERATTNDLVTALQKIARDAAKGKNPILAIKLLEMINNVFRDGNSRGNRQA